MAGTATKTYTWSYYNKPISGVVYNERIPVTKNSYFSIPFSYLTPNDVLLEGKISSIVLEIPYKYAGSSAASVETKFELINSKSEIYSSGDYITTGNIVNTSKTIAKISMAENNLPPISFFLDQDFSIKVYHGATKTGSSDIYCPESNSIVLKITLVTPNGYFYIWENNSWTKLSPKIWENGNWTNIDPKVY